MLYADCLLLRAVRLFKPDVHTLLGVQVGQLSPGLPGGSLERPLEDKPEGFLSGAFARLRELIDDRQMVACILSKHRSQCINGALVKLGNELDVTLDVFLS